MDKFTRELESGEIHLRDRWQLELKSEFFPTPINKENIYSQEFYLFIPNALQINEWTYSKEEFYRDQTNFVRYKTPIFTFSELLDPTNLRSPLCRLQQLLHELKSKENIDKCEDELKLLGNIVRSTLRTSTSRIFKLLNNNYLDKNTDLFDHEIHILCKEINEFHHVFLKLKNNYSHEQNQSLIQTHFNYIDEFINNSTSYYLTGLLSHIRSKNNPHLFNAEKEICGLLVKEQFRGRRPELKENNQPSKESDEMLTSEFILYRNGLLNKFVLDALLLHTSRTSPHKRLRAIIASFAAAIAMLIFFVLFVWQGQIFVINSQPFILATVILYVLKDRIKESLKNISFQKAFKWFPDYTTSIKSPNGKTIVGKLKESFSFVNVKDLSLEIITVRNKEFHSIIEDFQRPETVIYYKRTLEMMRRQKNGGERRHGLSLIFRFDIHHFLSKADDPYQTYLTIDPTSLDFITMHLPKVYHLNIILKNSYLRGDGSLDSELLKFRLILDKNGIKRVEQVSIYPSKFKN